jgi:hypothetical protein
MSVNASSHKMRILIGADNQNWSRAYISFDANQDKRDRVGLIRTTGTLKLGMVNNPPESMNPRLNQSRWFRGQRVIIDLTDSSRAYVRHLFGCLYIIAEPQPPDPTTPEITLQLGCWLTLRDFAQPSDDVSGANLNPVSPTPRHTIANNLLSAAGCPPLLDLIPEHPIPYPVPKESGSYVALAGEVAYGGRMALYQNNQGEIRARSLDTTISTPAITIRIGKDEIAYKPSEGSETPAEVVTCVGVGLDLTDNWGETIHDPEETYGDAAAISEDSYGRALLRRVEAVDRVDATSETKIITVWEPAGVIVPGSKDSGLVISDDSIEIKTYEPGPEGRLLTIEKRTNQALGKAISEFYSQIQDSKKWKDGAYRIDGNNPIQAERTLTTYTYSATGVVEKITIETWEPKGRYAADDYVELIAKDGAGNPQDPFPSGYSEIRYEEIRPGTWKKTETDQVPPTNLKFKSGVTAAQRIARRTVLSGGTYKTSTSTSGQEQPPAAERRSPRYGQKEKPLKGKAKFQITPNANQEREHSPIEIKTATSETQLEQIAYTEGTLLIGRKQGQRIQLPVTDAILATTAPLPEWRAVEPDGSTLIFQADAMSFSHDAQRAIVGAEGIWLGTIPAPTIGNPTPSPALPFQRLYEPLDWPVSLAFSNLFQAEQDIVFTSTQEAQSYLDAVVATSFPPNSPTGEFDNFFEVKAPDFVPSPEYGNVFGPLTLPGYPVTTPETNNSFGPVTATSLPPNTPTGEFSNSFGPFP